MGRKSKAELLELKKKQQEEEEAASAASSQESDSSVVVEKLSPVRQPNPEVDETNEEFEDAQQM